MPIDLALPMSKHTWIQHRQYQPHKRQVVVFNSELAKDVRKQLLRTLADEGYDYVILPEDATPTGSSSIETREDGLKCAELFRQNRDRIDGIIVSLPNFVILVVTSLYQNGNIQISHTDSIDYSNLKAKVG